MQSWGDYPSFNTPKSNNNKCDGQQQSGWNWGNLGTGGFSNYDGFDFSGFECANSFGKRDVLTKRDFQQKVIKGSMSDADGPMLVSRIRCLCPCTCVLMAWCLVQAGELKVLCYQTGWTSHVGKPVCRQLPSPHLIKGQMHMLTSSDGLVSGADGKMMVLRESLVTDRPGNRPARWTCPSKGCGIRKASTSVLYEHVDRMHAEELTAAACTHLALMAPFITPEGDLVARLSTSNRWGAQPPQLLSNQV